MSAKTNILFLFADQHSTRALGCYGNDEVRTPHLDQLAGQGVLLENAYTQNPICTPSRLCFLSSQYCRNHGYYGLMGPCPDHLPSLFTLTREAGYLNGAVGKIHTPKGWLSRHCDWVEDVYGHEETIPLPDDANAIDGSTNTYERYLEERGLVDQRDDLRLPEWKGDPRSQGIDARPSTLVYEDTVEGWIAGRTIRFIEHAQDEGRPFCLWMSLPRPHQTYLPAKEFWDLYDPDQFRLPPNADDDLAGRSGPARNTQRSYQESEDWRLFEPKDWDSTRRRVLRGYYGCVSQVDKAVGQVLSALERLGIRDNTLVVYSTDHGEFAGEHGLIEKAPGIGFRCVTRIPMIWSLPGRLPAGVRRQSLVESVDFLPTVCALTGLPEADWTDGQDITGLLENDQPVRKFAVTEHPLTKTIHSEYFKLTLYLEEIHGGHRHGELFDMINDPWERHNLYNDPDYFAVREELTYQLYSWMVRSAHPMTINPRPPVPGHPIGRFSWDSEEARTLYGKDGRLKRDTTAPLLAANRLNGL